MREQDFINFLQAEPSITSQANIRGRVRHAKKAEVILGISLDVVVANDDLMYESLVELRKRENILRGHMQNAVRKYSLTSLISTKLQACLVQVWMSGMVCTKWIYASPYLSRSSSTHFGQYLRQEMLDSCGIGRFLF